MSTAGGTAGIFLALEGGEGAGKSTQLRGVATRIRESGHQLLLTKEPGGSELGLQLRSILLAHREPSLDERCEALMFAADRAHHVASVVRPALARGEIVLTDRYIDSSLAYQGFGLGNDVEGIRQLSAWATRGLLPTLTLLLDLDPAVGGARVGVRGAADGIELRGEGFHTRVREGFLHLAALDPGRYAIIDASVGEAEVAERVWEAVRGVLPTPGAGAT